MLGGAAPGATPARAGARLPRRSRVPSRETIRGTDHRLISDQERGLHLARLARRPRRQQKMSLAIRASSHQGEQRFFRSVQLSAAVGNQFVKRIKVAANHLSVLEASDDLGTDIRTAADSRCVTENTGRFLDRFDYLPLSRSALLDDFRAQPRQRTCTNERTRPRAKIFSAEGFAHYFTNVGVDVMARYVYELTIAVLIFEDFA